MNIPNPTHTTDNPIASLFSVNNRVVVVTGGGRGIGEMIATGLVAAGAKVYIVGRDAEQLEKTAATLNEQGTCRPVQADISTPDGIAALVAAVSTHEDRVHALINNAGAVWAAPIDDYPLKGFEKVLSVNLVAPFFVAQSLLPLLRTAATAGEPARIINVGSTDGQLPPRYQTFAYSASKAGLHMLTRHLADQLREDGILVNTLAPGLFPTKMTSARFRDEDTTRETLTEIPLGRAGDALDATGAAIFLCSRASAYITGSILQVDGGYASLR